MRVEIRRIAIEDDFAVSAEVAVPDDHRPGSGSAIVLGHSAGGDMNDALLSAVHLGLGARGIVAVKFNFAYRERRRKLPDRMPALEACFRRVVESVEADDDLRPARLFLGGKSMGGRVASHLAAQGLPCAGLVFLGYPLHPAGKPEQLRTAHLPRIAVPMLFIGGTRDKLAELELLRPVLATLTVPIQLHVIEGADHSFKVPRSIGRTAGVGDEIVDVCTRWIGAS
jgi:uncharacterized protein